MTAKTLHPSRAVLAFLFLTLLFAGPATAPALPRPQAAQERVVAVGDIHGDLAAFRNILRQAGITDDRGRWVAQNTTLVQTGDAVDRGPHSRKVLDLLMDLEKQASRKKSRLTPLLGNHEVMDMTGDLRYVTVEEYAEFADSKSEKRRQSAWKDFVNWSRDRARAMGKPEPLLPEEPDADWLEAHPPGFFEHREAYAPGGKYGKWLRSHDTVATVGGRIFLHGGLSPNLPATSLEEINQRIRDEMKLFDDYVRYFSEKRLILPFFTLAEIAAAAKEEQQTREAAWAERSAQAAAEGKTFEPPAEEKQQVDILKQFLEYPSWWMINPEGPLWFRGYVRWSDEEGPALVDSLLAKFGASAFVVGHSTIKGGRIQARFDGKVFIIDTGMLASYYEGGRASALEIQGGTFTAVYPDQRTVVYPPPPAQPAGRPENTSQLGSTTEEPGGGAFASPPRASAASSSAGAPASHVWLDSEGKPLPFQTDDEIMDFLRTASVVSIKELGTGVTKPRKVRLEKDGISMNAIFHDINEERRSTTTRDGRRIRDFRDSYVFQVAAYHLAKLLGLDNCPPTVERVIDGKKGSLQAWVENATTETDRQKKKTTPPNIRDWNRQLQTMRLFDLLIYNWDRHTSNILIDQDWKVWMVDHTRAFRRESDLPYAEQIIVCERGLWERLQSLDDGAFRRVLSPYLREAELNALLERRRGLLKHLKDLIAAQGEETVLYSW